MAIKFRKQAVKFLEKADSETLSRVQEKLNQLLLSIEEQVDLSSSDIEVYAIGNRGDVYKKG
jgi:mRNA interferase RelE/StbE